jgi:hypothetical protein
MHQNDKNSEDSLFIEEMQIEIIREAHEWMYSEAYNQIGYLFDGYKTMLHPLERRACRTN